MNSTEQETKNQSIGKRLVSNFAIVASATLIAGIVGVVSLASVHSNFNYIIVNKTPHADVAMEMRIALAMTGDTEELVAQSQSLHVAAATFKLVN